MNIERVPIRRVHQCEPPMTAPAYETVMTPGFLADPKDAGTLWRCECGRWWAADPHNERHSWWHQVTRLGAWWRRHHGMRG